MSLFEVDISALNNLLSCLNNLDNELDTILSSIGGAFNNFDSSFISTDKGSFESTYNDLITHLKQSEAKVDELVLGLNHLLTFIQDAENVKF